MKLVFDCNKIKAENLQVKGDSVGFGAMQVVKKVRENFEYRDGKKTDNFLDTTISVTDTESYANSEVHVEGHLDITQAEIDNSEDVIFVQIDPTKTFIRPYSIEYGVAKCKVSTGAVTIIRE